MTWSAAAQRRAREEGGRDLGGPVRGQALRVHRRRLALLDLRREDERTGVDRVGGTFHDVREERVDVQVVAAHEVGHGVLELLQALVDDVRVQDLLPAAPAQPSALPSAPVQDVPAGGSALDLALVVLDHRGRQAEHRGDLREHSPGVVAVEPARGVAVVQAVGRRRGRGREDLGAEVGALGELAVRVGDVPQQRARRAEHAEHQPDRRAHRRLEDVGTRPADRCPAALSPRRPHGRARSCRRRSTTGVRPPAPRAGGSDRLAAAAPGPPRHRRPCARSSRRGAR